MRQKFLFILSIVFLYYSCAFAQTSPLNLYLTQDTANITESTAYPITGMGTGTVYGPEDWTYSNVKLDLYVVVSGSQKFFTADLTVQWDSTFLSLESHAGNLFTEKYFNTSNLTTGRQRINIASLNGNVLPAANKHLVKLSFIVLKPGVSQVNIVSSDMRYYDDINDVQLSIPVTSSNGTVKFYTGDFARSRTVLYRGDGDINFKDVAVFGQHYGGIRGSDMIYRAKYDIYPTASDSDYFRMPVGDGVIDFYDMVLFTIGYSYEAEGAIQNPFMKTFNNMNVKVELKQNPLNSGKAVYMIYASGGYSGLKALSVRLNYDAEYLKYSSYKCLNISPENGVMTGVIDNKGSLSIDASVLNYFGSTSLLPGEIYEVTFDVIRPYSGHQKVFITSAEAFDVNLRNFNTTVENIK